MGVSRDLHDGPLHDAMMVLASCGQTGRHGRGRVARLADMGASGQDMGCGTMACGLGVKTWKDHGGIGMVMARQGQDKG